MGRQPAHSLVPEEAWEGPQQLAAAGAMLRLVGRWLASPAAKGQLPAIMEMVMISQKDKLWKIPRTLS